MFTKGFTNDLKRQHRKEIAVMQKQMAAAKIEINAMRKELGEMRGLRDLAVSRLLDTHFYLKEIADGSECRDSVGLAKLGLCGNREGFFGELRNELRTQDNRITCDPLFIVQQERVVWGFDDSYADDYKWVFKEDVDHDADEDSIDELVREQFAEEHGHESPEDEELDPEDYGWKKVYYKKHWEFVTAHFTERAADLYLAQNSHNLHNPRVYVTSQNRCYEWNRIRKTLMA